MTTETTVNPASVLTKDAPVGAAPAPKMTFEEFMDWVDEETHAEWVAGEVILMSPCSDPHQDVTDFLTALIRLVVEDRQSGWVRSNPFLMRLRSRPSGREPDIVYVAEQNRSRLKQNYLDGPADLVVEIVSPESEQRDQIEKRLEYETAGVREYWVIDREHRQAKFYQLGARGKYRAAVIGKDGIYHSKVIDGLWLRVEWLWQPPKLLDVLKEWQLI